MASNQSLREESISSASIVQEEHIDYSRLWWAGLLAAIVTPIANLFVLFIAQNMLEITLLVPAGLGSTNLAPLPLASVLMASAIPAVGATILLAILDKFLEHPIRVFQIIAAVLLILSFTGPLGLPVGATIKAILSLMHVIGAVSIVWILTKLSQAPA